MPSQLEKSRLTAFRRQGGLCFYCNHPVWLDDPDTFRAQFPMSAPQHALRRCTAEHLIAKQDGGGNEPENVVAACWLCNARRHRCRRVRAPGSHRKYVQSRVLAGTWLPKGTLSVFAAVRETSKLSQLLIENGAE